jgi:hypothetical protein
MEASIPASWPVCWHSPVRRGIPIEPSGVIVRNPYPSDVTDQAWAWLYPDVPKVKPGG